MTKVPEAIEGVKVPLKANVYFDGKVVSHTLLLPGGQKKTVGLIYAGSFTFNTDAAERMDILAGTCKVRLKGQTEWNTYGAGTFFQVPAKSAFDITVENGLTEYLCSFE
jgi:purine/pyrimidine-nucleoside phosphorylase